MTVYVNVCGTLSEFVSKKSGHKGVSLMYCCRVPSTVVVRKTRKINSYVENLQRTVAQQT